VQLLLIRLLLVLVEILLPWILSKQWTFNQELNLKFKIAPSWGWHLESAAIMGVAMATIMLFGISAESRNFYFGLVEIGIMTAICITGTIIGIVSALPTR
jgi:hypothetical protein